MNAFTEICRDLVKRAGKEDCDKRFTACNHPELKTPRLVLWSPFRGDVRRGKRHHTYMDNLVAETNLECTQDFEAVRIERDV